MANASLTWLDLTAADRDKVRPVLDLFSELGTVDELGVGKLRFTVSNAMFPGTSVLQWTDLGLPNKSYLSTPPLDTVRQGRRKGRIHE